MGTIKVIEAIPDLNRLTTIKIEVRTSAGRMVYPVRTHDQGSTEANQRAAFRDLQTLLEESLALVWLPPE